MNPRLGALAALTTAILWTGTSTLFTQAGRRVGSVVVNRARLALAAIFLTLTHMAVYGEIFPLQATVVQWLWLSASGVVGLILGDALLFQAFVWIGPRISMLLMSLAPLMAAVISWFALGEKLNGMQILGIGLALGGVVLVVQDRGNPHGEVTRQRFFRGILFGLGAALGQALGLVGSKIGMGQTLPALSANWIRMVSAATVIWLWTGAGGEAKHTIERLRTSAPARLFILCGAFTGPFLGVWLSLVAIQHTTIGVASTLMGLTPIFLIPVGRFLFQERFGWPAVLGTLIAMSGVALLFLA